MIEKGLRIESVNVGGLHYSPGKVQILKNISLDEKDVKIIREVEKFGATLEARVIPSDEKLDLSELIERKYNPKDHE